MYRKVSFEFKQIKHLRVKRQNTQKIMNYYDFNELNTAADISTLQRISSNPRIVRTPNGNELHDCCPFTGEGNDRFWIRTDDHPMTWFCRWKGSCPNCSGGGDAMQFIAMREHLDRKADAQKIAGILAAEIGITPRKVSKQAAAILAAFSANPSTPCNVSGTDAAKPQKKEAPRTPTAPPKQWQWLAGTIVETAARTLRSFTNPEAVEALEYLHSRGITDKMIDRYKIGYIPTVQKYFGYYVDLVTGDKKFRQPKHEDGESFIWVPEGITIPTYINGELYRVKVRKLNRRAAEKAISDTQRAAAKAAAEGKPTPSPVTEHDCRYSHISGGKGTALFNADAAADMHPRHDIIFVEGELDALLINSIVQPLEGDTLQAVTFGSATDKPPFETYYRYFRTPERIVIAYDNDDEGHAGAEYLKTQIMNIATRETPPIIETIPEGYKDFGEYYAAGGDIYDLVSKWFPL